MNQLEWWTEVGWLASENPYHLLSILRKQHVKSSRKHRLLAVACCYRVWERFSGVGRHTVEIVERYADRQAKFTEMTAARLQTWQFARGQRHADILAFEATHRVAEIGLSRVLHRMLGVAWGGPEMVRPTESYGWVWPEPSTWRQACRTLCHLIRDIFRNPFCTTAVDSSWLWWNDRIVPRLAQAIYDEYAFDRLPILADALEEAGCTDADILNHCRQPGEHVRGCWVVDLILGKS